MSFALQRSFKEARNLSQAAWSGSFKTRQCGAANTLDWRLWLEDQAGEPISFWHDVPLYADNSKSILNMVIEIPRWSNAKLEISKEESLNPIFHDINKGKLRFVKNCFPHHGYIWNYGAFPQTWEDPSTINLDTKAKGDDDPLDVCEIGEQIGCTGQIKQVKVLGVIALLDEGETDWKVIAIDINDPLASQLNDIQDVERHLPGLMRATKDWFRIYKIPDGKPENKFAFNGEAKDKKYASEIVDECNKAWKRLKDQQSDAGSSSKQSMGNVRSVKASVPDDAPQPPAAIDPKVNKWFFV